MTTKQQNTATIVADSNNMKAGKKTQMLASFNLVGLSGKK